MIIDRYLQRQIVRPLLLVCVALVLVFAGYASSIYLAAASEGLISRSAIVRLIALKTIIAMEVLLPISLYLTVVVGIGRLYENLEITALRACGFGTSKILRAALGVVAPVAVLTGILSIYVRPWAYEKSYLLRSQAVAQVDLTNLEGDRFYFDPERDRVLFVEEVDDGQLNRIFVAVGKGEDRKILFARTGRIKTASANRAQSLILEDIHVYGTDPGFYSLESQGSLELRVDAGSRKSARYRRKAEPTARLARSSAPGDRAELQWRLSRPISTLLLGLLAVFLARTNKRRGIYSNVFRAALIYVVYYSTSILARSWVRHGAVNAAFGMWWVDLLLGLILSWKILQAVRIPGEGRRR